ncbi:MAG TPA: SGNH/GDSL hydrolase family protein [Terriglobales bacterium]|jgi:lysophospholipase L1-like esterase|nr:SGNH/GDSL hydrolase family protein [Terriglobales bacterium]
MDKNSNQYHFARSVALSLGLLFVLFILAFWSPRLPKTGAAGLFARTIAQATGRNPFLGQAGNGYYEDLMGKHNSTPEIDPLQWILRGKFPRSAALHSIYQDHNFLEYEGRPNVWLPHPEEQPIASSTFGFTEGPVETNSYGFFDREHTLSKPVAKRRIAIFGDSLTRGWGVPMNERYSTLLEERLNTGPGKPFEVLNFAVSGYVPTQMFYMAVEKAPQFHPDVYILALTGLSASSNWGTHIAKLAKEGLDLKYDFLRDAIVESGLEKSDSPELSNWKLAPYGDITLRTLLLGLKSRIEKQSAQMLVILVPSVEDQQVTERQFRVVRRCLSDTGIPVIDLTDTFNGSDIESLRVSWYDVHPNARGHQMIADNLYKKLRANPAAWAAIMGEEREFSRAPTGALRSNSKEESHP